MLLGKDAIVCVSECQIMYRVISFCNSVDGLKAEKGTQTRYILISLELE